MGNRETEREREICSFSFNFQPPEILSGGMESSLCVYHKFMEKVWLRCGLEWKLETRCGVLLFLLEIGFLEILFFVYYSIGRIFFNCTFKYVFKYCFHITFF